MPVFDSSSTPNPDTMLPDDGCIEFYACLSWLWRTLQTEVTCGSMEYACFYHEVLTMTDITNSHSLTDFQRNARGFIEGLNETKRPVLLTVNGKVQAVLVDPATFQDMEDKLHRERFIEAIREGERAIQEGKTCSAEEVYVRMKTKHGF
jgi:PHD/YefM family antitoxin component YafN of YafNO toxin-antitoxin module